MKPPMPQPANGRVLATHHVDVPPSRRLIPSDDMLSSFTTFHTGGPADRIVVARTEEEVLGAVQEADANHTPLLICAGGSNMLVSDEGFPGTVLVMAVQGIEADATDNTALVSVAAGEVWDHLVDQAVAHDWVGIEALTGIPGLVGAAPVQNIGAYGAQVSTTIVNVRVYDRVLEEIRTLENEECGFGYRTSIFKRNLDRYVILGVDFLFAVGDVSAKVEYPELAAHLGITVGSSAPISDVRAAVFALRRSKGMVVDDTDHDTWSAGSFFTNPILSSRQAAALPADAPRFPQPDGRVKTSAAWLIDHAGFHKGYGDQRASLSTKHVLALTNRGSASTADIIALARRIRDGVDDAFGVILTPEPVLVGVDL